LKYSAPCVRAYGWFELSLISQSKIRELHSQGESSRLDYKLLYDLSQDSEKMELAKDVCSIANFLYQTSGYGYLVIGIEDGTKRVVGINPTDYAETRIQQIVSSRTDPPPIFSVQHVVYRSVNLVVISLRRSTSGPHQVIRNSKPVGFPIRRGSTNDMMSTNEVFQAMQVRGRNFRRQPSDYETLSPGAAYRQLLDDCINALYELGYNRRSTVRIDYPGKHRKYGGYSPGRVFIKAVKTINRRRWNLFFSVEVQNATQVDLFRFDSSINGFLDENSRHRSIFIHLVGGSISSSYYTNREQFSSSHIRVTIEPRITYFGLGEGVSARVFTREILTKFFVSHIKSKEDIKMRIELIINWIRQHREMFDQIREVLQS